MEQSLEFLTSNEFHGAYDSNKFKKGKMTDYLGSGINFHTGELMMQCILNAYLELVSKDSDVAIDDIKEAFSDGAIRDYLLEFFESEYPLEDHPKFTAAVRESLAGVVISKLRKLDVLGNYWKVQDSKFDSKLAEFNFRKQYIKRYGAEKFLDTRYNSAYIRYSGDMFSEWLDTLKPYDGLIPLFYEYMKEGQAFREYAKYLPSNIIAGSW